MKRLLIIVFALISCTYYAHAQIYVSCTHRDYYTYNETEEDLEYEGGYDENSMFEINKELTMFKHTTPTMTSAYYASSSDYDEEDNTLSMDVTSDVGNSYVYIFDFKSNSVKILYNKDDAITLIVFTVKKWWIKE